MYKNVSNAMVTNKRYRIILYHMDVNLNLYKYFLAVTEEKSVIKAAIKLGVSQPTVSYSIHMLQRELGEKLFTVERSGIVPGERALILYERLKPVYWLLIQTIEEFTRSKKL